MARNSTPLARLKPASGGDVLIKLKARWSDGTTHLRFSGVELCERLAALVPPPRLNLIRFGGCFAPRHKLRAHVVAQAPKASAQQRDDKATQFNAGALAEGEMSEASSPAGKKYSLSWNELRARVFEEDLSSCRRCGGKIKITAALLDREAIIRILAFHGLATAIPKFHPPYRDRAPPSAQGEFEQIQVDFSLGRWGEA